MEIKTTEDIIVKEDRIITDGKGISVEYKEYLNKKWVAVDDLIEHLNRKISFRWGLEQISRRLEEKGFNIATNIQNIVRELDYIIFEIEKIPDIEELRKKNKELLPTNSTPSEKEA